MKKGFLNFFTLLVILDTERVQHAERATAITAQANTQPISLIDKMSASVRKVVGMNTADSFPSNGATGGNDYPSWAQFRQTLNDFVEGKVFDIYDGVTEIGSIDTSYGLFPLNVTSYQALFPKMFMLNLLTGRIDIPRYSAAPISRTFDSNGEFTIGVDTFSSISVAPNAADFASRTIGYFGMFKAGNTLLGDSTVTATYANGWAQTYQLQDITGTGGFFLWNCAAQQDAALVSAVSVAAPPVLAVTQTLTLTNSPNDWLVSTSPQNIIFTGFNATVFIYQVTITTALKNLIWSHFVANALPDLGASILSEVRAMYGAGRS